MKHLLRILLLAVAALLILEAQPVGAKQPAPSTEAAARLRPVGAKSRRHRHGHRGRAGARRTKHHNTHHTATRQQ